MLVSVKYTVKPGMRDEFFRKVFEQGIISDSRAEAGNIKYEYAASLESDDVLCLFEVWNSDESFMLHGKTPHYQKLQALKQQYVAGVS